jgi:hypothetical protein
MAQYKVISDNCGLGNQGETVDSDKFEGVNFDALVEGGHIVEAKGKTESKEQDTK